MDDWMDQMCWNLKYWFKVQGEGYNDMLEYIKVEMSLSLC